MRSIGSLCFILLITSSVIANSSAWSHGYSSYPFADTPADYKPNENFGTMDWFALMAYRTMLAYLPDRWNWIDNFWREYYTGTEFPFNSDLHLILNHTEVQGTNEGYSIRIEAIGDEIQNGTVFNRIDSTGKKVFDLLKKGNYEAAAFYAGAYISYLSLCASFPLFICDGTTYADYWESYNDRINYYTMNDGDPTWFFTHTANITTPPITWALGVSLSQKLLSYNITNYSECFTASKFVASKEEWHEGSDATQRFYNTTETILNDIILECAQGMVYIMLLSGVSGDAPTNSSWFVDAHGYAILAVLGGSLFIVGLFTLYQKKMEKRKSPYVKFLRSNSQQ